MKGKRGSNAPGSNVLRRNGASQRMPKVAKVVGTLGMLKSDVGKLFSQISFLLSPPLPGLFRCLSSLDVHISKVTIWCVVLYNMEYT